MPAKKSAAAQDGVRIRMLTSIAGAHRYEVEESVQVPAVDDDGQPVLNKNGTPKMRKETRTRLMRRPYTAEARQVVVTSEGEAERLVERNMAERVEDADVASNAVLLDLRTGLGTDGQGYTPERAYRAYSRRPAEPNAA